MPQVGQGLQESIDRLPATTVSGVLHAKMKRAGIIDQGDPAILSQFDQPLT